MHILGAVTLTDMAKFPINPIAQGPFFFVFYIP